MGFNFNFKVLILMEYQIHAEIFEPRAQKNPQGKVPVHLFPQVAF